MGLEWGTKVAMDLYHFLIVLLPFTFIFNAFNIIVFSFLHHMPNGFCANRYMYVMQLLACFCDLTASIGYQQFHHLSWGMRIGGFEN